MNILKSIEDLVSDNTPTPTYKGDMRTIKACFDPISNDFLNIGVIYSHNGNCEYKLLNSFSRFECLYGDRVNTNQVVEFIEDIEIALNAGADEIESLDLGPYIKISEPRYAAGHDTSEIVLNAYNKAVSLGRPRINTTKREFHFRTTASLRHQVLRDIDSKLELFLAKQILHPEFVRFTDQDDRVIKLKVPLKSDRAVGNIVSAWYADTQKISLELLSALVDTEFAMKKLNYKKGHISVLRPNSECGLTQSKFKAVNSKISDEINRIKDMGLEVLQSDESEELSNITAQWWTKEAS